MGDRTEPVDDPLTRARQVASAHDALELYEAWADTYDHDVFTTMGVTGSTRIAEILADHLADRSTSVLDLGCGTGAVGEHLATLGFSALTGIDFSPAMLAVAERSGVYRRLIEADLTDPTALPHDFGASVSAGTFTSGHVTGTSVSGLLGLLTPGATIAWTVAPSLWPGVAASMRTAGVEIISDTVEQIRPDADDRAHMVVGILPSATPPS